MYGIIRSLSRVLLGFVLILVLGKNFDRSVVQYGVLGDILFIVLDLLGIG